MMVIGVVVEEVVLKRLPLNKIRIRNKKPISITEIQTLEDEKSNLKLVVRERKRKQYNSQSKAHIIGLTFSTFVTFVE